MHAGIQLHPSGHQLVSNLVSSPSDCCEQRRVSLCSPHWHGHFFFCGPELALKTKWTTILFDDENLQTAAQCGVVRMTDV